MWIVGRAYHVDVGLFNQPDISLHRPAVDKESHTGMEVVTVHSFQLDGFPVDFEDVSRDFYFPYAPMVFERFQKFILPAKLDVDVI
jgi:hypothetical protein